MKKWEVRILPNKRALFVHQHDWHVQLYVSAYKKGIVNASLLGRDNLEDFAKSAVTALQCSDFEHMVKKRYVKPTQLRGIRLNCGFTTLLVTKDWLANTMNPTARLIQRLRELQIQS